MAFFLALLPWILGIPLLYFYVLALGSCFANIRRALLPPESKTAAPSRYAIAIAAHDEAAVIAETVRALRTLDYPADRYDIHIVADRCADATAELARGAGAVAHERNEDGKRGKGAALSWLFQRILRDDRYDAVVVFDADTRVEGGFLRAIDSAFASGADVVQGQHQISNAHEGWFPALTEAKFLIDNQIQNLGRSALALSAKNMGDSIALRSGVLRSVGWGDGLTEDYQLRQKLLLAGYVIEYAPEAIGQGEAPPTWGQARTQRIRWMKGANEVSKSFRFSLLIEGLKSRSAALLDAALESYLPTYSTVIAVTAAGAIGWAAHAWVTQDLAGAGNWLALIGLCLAYPFLGLLLAGAPGRSYRALLCGPVFVAWRAWAALKLRIVKPDIAWVRTQHGRTSG